MGELDLVELNMGLSVAYLKDCIEYLDEMISELDKASGNLEELKHIVYPPSSE